MIKLNLIKIAGLFFSLCLFSQGSLAETGYVRNQNFEIAKFKEVLAEYGSKSLLQAFNDSTAVQNLEKIEISSNQKNLRSNIQSLTSLPLRVSEQEALLSLYEKIDRLNFDDAVLIHSLFLSIPNSDKNYLVLFNKIKPLLRNQKNIITKNDLSDLLPYNTEDSNIYIDGVQLTDANQNEFITGKHQWFYISNTYSPILLNGNQKEFEAKLQQKKFFSEACMQKIDMGKDLKLSTYALDGTNICKPLNRHQNFHSAVQDSFFKKQEEDSKRNWFWPVTILTSVAIAYELRNKDVLIHMPSFKF
jgi:hypothetical protein